MIFMEFSNYLLIGADGYYGIYTNLFMQLSEAEISHGSLKSIFSNPAFGLSTASAAEVRFYMVKNAVVIMTFCFRQLHFIITGPTL